MQPAAVRAIVSAFRQPSAGSVPARSISNRLSRFFQKRSARSHTRLRKALTIFNRVKCFPNNSQITGRLTNQPVFRPDRETPRRPSARPVRTANGSTKAMTAMISAVYPNTTLYPSSAIGNKSRPKWAGGRLRASSLPGTRIPAPSALIIYQGATIVKRKPPHFNAHFTEDAEQGSRPFADRTVL